MSETKSPTPVVAERKPCPLCGEPPFIVRRSEAAWGVRCVKEDHFAHSYGASEAAAVDAWNRRADHALAGLQAQVETLTTEDAPRKGECWVLQRNDFPHAVFFDKAEADAALAQRRKAETEWREQNAHVADVRTYWNLYKAQAALSQAEQRLAEAVKALEGIAVPGNGSHWGRLARHALSSLQQSEAERG